MPEKTFAKPYRTPKYAAPRKKPRFPFRWVGLILLILILLTAGISGIIVARDPHDFRIVEGVSVGGLDLSGMTPLEASRALKNASGDLLESAPLLLELPQETMTLEPKAFQLSMNHVSAVRDAFRIGRSAPEDQSKTIGLLPYLKYNENHLQDLLAGYAEKYDTQYLPSEWKLEGNSPDLSLQESMPSGVQQTLILTKGISETRLDQEEAKARILNFLDSAFAAGASEQYRVRDFVTLIPTPLETVDIPAIHQELYVAPVNDSLSLETYQPVSGSYGLGFDVSSARIAVLNADEGESVSIPMYLEEPEIIGDAVYFRDVLGYCETPHTNNENRNHNLAKACEAMDGVILQPGEVFSYNDTLGERSKENGWKLAGAYSGLNLVQSYGGGICQGSSTIYCAALYADLEIVFRINHGFAVNYMPHGLDATVSWNGPDFQFRNSTHFPIKIAAEVSDGYVKVTLLGTEERDYYIEMESKATWGDEYIYAKSYKCKYDRETGELISRELEARSNYMR